MKTIAEKAKEYANGVFGDFIESVDFFTSEDIENAVKHGVELAQKWISVNEELPSNNFNVLYKDSDGEEFLAFYTPELKKWTKYRSIGMPIECDNIIYWRPINVK